MRILELTEETKGNILENLLKRSPNSYGKFESAVADILANVKSRGDDALFEYTRNFDKVIVHNKIAKLLIYLHFGITRIISMFFIG